MHSINILINCNRTLNITNQKITKLHLRFIPDPGFFQLFLSQHYCYFILIHITCFLHQAPLDNQESLPLDSLIPNL